MAFSAAPAGGPRPDALPAVFHSRGRRVCLGRLQLCRRVLGDQRAFEHHRRRPPIYPFKTIIPVAGAFILMQGIVEIIRCVICLKQGEWPRARKTCRKWTSTKLKETWSTSRTRISPSSINRCHPARRESLRKEVWFGLSIMAAVVIMVFRPDAGAVADDQRPPGPADARPDRGGHHARVSHRLHADGDGRVLRLARVPQREPGSPTSRSST